MYVTSFSVFHAEAAVSIGLNNWEILEVNKEVKNNRKEVKTPYPTNNSERT